MILILNISTLNVVIITINFLLYGFIFIMNRKKTNQNEIELQKQKIEKEQKQKEEENIYRLNDNLSRVGDEFSAATDYSFSSEREQIILSNVRNIYEDIIAEYFNLDLSSNENNFIWETKKLVFNFIKISYQPSSIRDIENLKVSTTSTVKLFISTSNDDSNHITFHDVVDETKTYDLQKESYSDRYLNLLIEKNILKIERSSIINDTFSFIHGDIDYIRNWVESEYDQYSKELSKPLTDNFSYHEKRIYLNQNRFINMIKDIGNEQFEAELLECLYAFEQQKWYICASGLGGLLEHLMFLILNNYNDLSLLKSRTPTASNYISAFKSSQNIHFEQREERQINALFEIRNSISHFNGGYTAKGQCEYLLNGIRDIYINYYIPSKKHVG